MADSKQIEVVKQRIADLKLETTEVQKKLALAEGFFGRWRMSSQQLNALIEEKKELFQKIEEHTARLEQLCAPVPPPLTKWQRMNEFGEELSKQISWCSVAGGAFWAWWRY